MSEPETTTEVAEQPPRVAGMLAEFESAEALIDASRQVREAGYRRFDAHSPFPVHGIDAAVGIRPTILPWLVLGAGLTGMTVATLMQWWMNAVDYPYLISGKPYFSLPANIPVTFELIVLFSAFAAFLGVFVLNRLPEFSHPLSYNKRFRRATSDGFFISVEAADSAFDEQKTRALLESTGASAVEPILIPAVDQRIPKLIPLILIGVCMLALFPPALIAWYRVVPKRNPRIHPMTDMAFQPKYKAQTANPLFADGRAMRQPVTGTVAWGELRLDEKKYLGKDGDQWATQFPMEVTGDTMRRGQERFRIYCSICHGLTGEGDGMAMQRALKRGDWPPPVSLHADSVADQPLGQIYNTITNGVRTMPGYESQISVEDRWAIVAYLKALQRSQNATLDDVPEANKLQLR